MGMVVILTQTFSQKDVVNCAPPLGMGNSIFPPVLTFSSAALLNQSLPASETPAIFLLRGMSSARPPSMCSSPQSLLLCTNPRQECLHSSSVAGPVSL